MNAMILAAGIGVRMRPLTSNLPKPLLKVKGKPLIDYHLEALGRAHCDRVVINVHYLADQIIDHIGDGSRHGIDVVFSHEPVLLETAGGIRKALPLLGDAPFVVVSADVFTDFDFSSLSACADLAHLVMVDNPTHHPTGDFALDPNALVRLAGDRKTWASIGVMTPALFRLGKAADLERPQRLREVFDLAIAAGRVTGEWFGGRWDDVGTPERLSALNR